MTRCSGCISARQARHRADRSWPIFARLLGVADAFLSRHTFLCRPLSDRFGCTGVEAARAAEDSDITVSLGGGTITFDWATILHEMFHVSGVADLHVYGETATAAEEAAGEFETYYAPQGAEMEDPQWRRYPSAAPLRNADSYRRLVEAVSADDFVDAQPSARFAPTLAAGFGFQLPDGSPTIMARVAFTPLGRGLHFITPGAVGFLVADPGSAARHRSGCHAGERLCRWRTRGSRGHGVGSRGRRVRSRSRRGRSVDAERFRRSRRDGPRFGRPPVWRTVIRWERECGPDAHFRFRAREPADRRVDPGSFRRPALGRPFRRASLSVAFARFPFASPSRGSGSSHCKKPCFWRLNATLLWLGTCRAITWRWSPGGRRARFRAWPLPSPAPARHTPPRPLD